MPGEFNSIRDKSIAKERVKGWVKICGWNTQCGVNKWMKFSWRVVDETLLLTLEIDCISYHLPHCVSFWLIVPLTGATFETLSMACRPRWCSGSHILILLLGLSSIWGCWWCFAFCGKFSASGPTGWTVHEGSLRFTFHLRNESAFTMDPDEATKATLTTVDAVAQWAGLAGPLTEVNSPRQRLFTLFHAPSAAFRQQMFKQPSLAGASQMQQGQGWLPQSHNSVKPSWSVGKDMPLPMWPGGPSSGSTYATSGDTSFNRQREESPVIPGHQPSRRGGSGGAGSECHQQHTKPTRTRSEVSHQTMKSCLLNNSPPCMHSSNQEGFLTLTWLFGGPSITEYRRKSR